MLYPTSSEANVIRRYFKVFCFLSFCLSPICLLAESAQNENAQSWLINPVSPNWTCSVAPGLPALTNCFAPDPTHYAYVGVEPVVVKKLVGGSLQDRMYFYTQFWGIGGAGSECFGDNIVLFEAPYTSGGVKGNEGLTYKGMVRPCDGAYWGLGSAFKDPSLGAIFIAAGRTTSDTSFKEIYYGKSLPEIGSQEDDGIYFEWAPLITTTRNDLHITEIEVRPHPTTPRLWWGFMSFNNTNDAYYFAMVPVKIDWNMNPPMFQYKKSATEWESIPVGGNITVMPSSQLASRSTSFNNVRGRWELWVDGNSGTQLPNRSAVPPCGFPANPATNPTYVANMNDFMNSGHYRYQAGGSDISYYVVNSDFSTSGPRDLVSNGPNGIRDYGTAGSDDIRANPADYGMGFVMASRFDVPGGWALYTGSQDATICSYNVIDWHPWSGSGVRFTSLQDITNCTIPATPSPTAPLNGAIAVSTQPLLDWSDASFATSYRVQVSTDVNFLNLVGDFIGAPSSWVVAPALVPGSTYYWRVRAFNSCDTSNFWSATQTFTTYVNNAEFISQSPPPNCLAAGQTYNVSVTMRNTGNSTWTSPTYKLGSQNPQDNLNWGLNRVSLPNSVPPTSAVTFNFTITAPNTPGTYNFQWRMLQENVQWFGTPTANVSVNVIAGQTPYYCTPTILPGLIQAEDFDNGGEGIAYHDSDAGNIGGFYRSTGVDITVTADTGGGYIVGWIVPGEWLEYTVNVPTAGAYTLEARVAAFNYGGSFHVEFNQVNVTPGGIPIPNTGGWDTWVTVRRNVTLSAGNNQIMRIAMDSGGYYGYVGNINHIRIAQYQGYLDAADCQYIAGWAWDKGQPNTPISVDIYNDGILHTTYPANAFRQDLLNAGIGNGYHAFFYPVPSSWKNGVPHSISVRYTGTNDQLIGSPRTITCTGPSVSIAWIHPAEETWGPPGSLTVAGYALNGSGTVQLVWRDATINGSWNTVAYQATPSPTDGSWSNSIPAPTDKCHVYQAYANYSGTSSSVFTYNGVAQGDCTIQVVSGTYGENCGAPTGNATWHLAPTCNGQTVCNYTVSVYTLGDPVPGCAKNYVARWTCGGGPTIRIATAPPEAGWGSVVQLNCN